MKRLKFKRTTKWRFKTAIIAYIVLWIIAIVIISSVVWNKLIDYQKDYDKQLEINDPKIIVEECMKTITKDNIDKLIKADKEIVFSEYEDINQVCDYYAEVIELNEVTYKYYGSNTEHSYYDVYAGENVICRIILDAAKEKSSHGFIIWENGRVSFKNYILCNNNIKVRIPSNCILAINGKAVQDTYITQKAIKDELSDKVFEICAVNPTKTEYEINGFFGQPTITVTNPSGIRLQATYTNGVYIYDNDEPSTFVSEISKDVYAGVENYASYILRLKEIEDIQPYIKNGSDYASDIAKIVRDWNDIPSSVDFKDKSISRVTKYNDNYASCRVKMIEVINYKGYIIREMELNFDIILYKASKDGKTIWQIAYQAIAS